MSLTLVDEGDEENGGVGMRWLMFGGRGLKGETNDLWSLTLTAERRLEFEEMESNGNTAGKPAARHRHRALHWNGYLVIILGAPMWTCNDVWMLHIENGAWKRIVPRGSGPIYGLESFACGMLTEDHVVLYGGMSFIDPGLGGSDSEEDDDLDLEETVEETVTNQVYVLSLKEEKWMDVSQMEGMDKRRNMAYGMDKNRLMIFGGDDERYVTHSGLWGLELSFGPWSTKTHWTYPAPFRREVNSVLLMGNGLIFPYLG
eukprot:TRINITY_DN2222_c0_g2_i2.p1 TRINITY_DN2222_c0_g2~~TRINITY_DN2222_c0_g2_i2.p1  ORF type:complete len:258 (-),score=67.32 TRINITY_DN2222_c0_g2_i2:3-776(-)